MIHVLKNSPATRILGIDPGFGRVGWGIIEGERQSWSAVSWGCIETDKEASFADRLLAIQKEILSTIKKYQPGMAGVEKLFFSKNTKTAMQVAEARGAILLLLANAHLPICEYTPLQVKQAVTGYGNAEKGQVEKVMALSLGMKALPKQDDAADALAIALTTALFLSSPHGGKGRQPQEY